MNAAKTTRKLVALAKVFFMVYLKVPREFQIRDVAIGYFHSASGVIFVSPAVLFTLRQASGRAWRIGQKEACRIVYFYYEGTMQDRAMVLMAKKLTAAQALEGTFTSEGLVALAGEDANVELALARSLVERMDEGNARRMWSKVANPSNIAIPLNEPVPALFSDELEPSILPKRRRKYELCAAGMLF